MPIPKLTRRCVFTGFSFAYLLALTVLGSWALWEAGQFSLPISKSLPAFTVALPAIAGLLYETAITFQQHLGTNRRGLQASTALQVVTAVLLVYETVLATLTATHITPASGLECALQERWQHMYRRKDARSVRLIQDAFDCCGLKTVLEMAWPFNSKNNPNGEACMVRFEREKSCYEMWKGKEQQVAIVMLVVPIGVFLWQTFMIFMKNWNGSWRPSGVRLPDDALDGPNRHHRSAIEYRDDGEQTDTNNITAEVNRLNRDANLGSRVESSREQESSLIQEQDIERWRRE